MSIQHCEKCNQNIDTDFDAEHFEKHFNENIDTYLADSAYFDEFFQKADQEIAEHLQEINGGKIPLTEEVKSYAQELWEEYEDGQMPF